MSVALIVNDRTHPEVPASVFVPIASQEGYSRLCMAQVGALSLKWIPLFETGCPVPPDAIAEVADEFRKLQQVLREVPANEPFVRHLDRVVGELIKYAGRSDVEVWIG